MTVIRDGAGGRLLLGELASEDDGQERDPNARFLANARAPRLPPPRVRCADASSLLQGSMPAEAGVNPQSERSVGLRAPTRRKT